jgi:hypothetical protein
MISECQKHPSAKKAVASLGEEFFVPNGMSVFLFCAQETNVTPINNGYIY